MLHVYNQQKEQQQKLDAAQMALYSCSQLGHPDQWAIFLQTQVKHYNGRKRHNYERIRAVEYTLG